MPGTSEPSRYELREPLGAGGMGQVYRAYDRVLRRDVALKLLRADLAAGSNGRDRLLREARMAATLSHPNICVVHDVGEIDGRPFVTMELLAGETLRRHLLRNPRVPLDEAARIGREVASALAGAHGRGVIHRDIKPENVMLLPDGRVKVLDFGLAKALDAALSEQPPLETISHISTLGLPPLHPHGTLPVSDDSLTTPGQILGTYHYLSPEQAEAKPADARSDVFSFGVVMYEMLAGRQPFTGPTAEALLAAIRADQPLPLEKTRPEVGAPLREVVQRCLNKVPEKRFPSGTELLARLDAVARPKPALPRWVAMTAVALGVLATGVAAWLALQQVAAPPDSAARPVLPSLKQITFDGLSFFPHLSPDGSQVAFFQVARPKWKVMVMPARGGVPRALRDGVGMLGWNATGDAILGMVHEQPRGLWEIPLTDAPARKILESGGFFDFDPTGREMVYTRLKESEDGRDIIRRDLSSGAEAAVYAPDPRKEDCYKPRWSPDGARIAFECFDLPTGRTRMYVGRPDGAGIQELRPEGMEFHGTFDWTPDSRAIVVGAIRGTLKNLWVVPVPGAGGEPRQITMGVDQDAYATVDPLGRFAIFDRRAAVSNLVMLDGQSGAVADDMPDLADTRSPSIRPDGAGLFTAQIRNGIMVVLANTFGARDSIPISAERDGSCEDPVAVGAAGVAYVCQDLLPQTQGGARNPGYWRRTIHLAPGPKAPPRPVLEAAGNIDLLASSPDARAIVYTLESQGTPASLNMLDLDSGESRLLATARPGESFPAATWDIGGEQVVLLATRHEEGGDGLHASIEVLAPAGGRREQRLSFAAEVTEAALSRDASMLAYTEVTGRETMLWVRPAAQPGEGLKLASFARGTQVRSLTWTPDAKHVIVEKSRSRMDLFLLEGIPLGGFSSIR